MRLGTALLVMQEGPPLPPFGVEEMGVEGASITVVQEEDATVE